MPLKGEHKKKEKEAITLKKKKEHDIWDENQLRQGNGRTEKRKPTINVEHVSSEREAKTTTKKEENKY